MKLFASLCAVSLFSAGVVSGTPETVDVTPLADHVVAPVVDVDEAEPMAGGEACNAKWESCLSSKPVTGKARQHARKCDKAWRKCVRKDRKSCRKTCRAHKKSAKAACRKAFRDEVCPIKGKDRKACVKQARAEKKECMKAAAKNCRAECK